MKKSRIIAVILAALTIFSIFCSCGSTAKKPELVTNSSSNPITQLGSGKNRFILNVVDNNGRLSEFAINTDEKTVGSALKNIDMIRGKEGPYGLYVTVVNSIRAEYETDGCYWAFYIGDELSTTGVDSVEIAKDTVYTFRVEKA